MYKNTIVIAGFLLAGIDVSARTEQKLHIENATIFLHGAQLTSTAKVRLQKGENEIVFTNVAGHINTGSITVNAGNGAVVESVVFQKNYLTNDVLSPRANEIKDSLEILEGSRNLVKNKIATINEQIAVLQGNRKVGGDQGGLSVAELTKMLDLIAARMEGYLNQKQKQEDQLKKTDEYVKRLKQQLDEESRKGYQPGGQLLVKLHASDAVSNDIVISYTVPNAGWTPVYDIRVDDIAKPAGLFYKANVYQNSGVQWDNVHLTISTGNPNEGVQAPVIQPWYISFLQPYAAYNRTNSYAKENVMPAAVAIRGNRALADAETAMGEHVVVDNGGVATTFDIDLPYTIPSDGKQNLVAMKKYDLAASYRYYAVPRMDKDAFLQAQVTEWHELNLISGKTNIFYEGTYVGEGYIDVRNTSDTLTFSLGRDKKVVVRRELDKKRCSAQTIGFNIKESYAYSISVRNTRRNSINIVIDDQVPVSADKDIVVESIETGNAEHNEGNGILKWNLTLKPNETANLKYGYTVKFPKGKQVAGLR